MRKYSIYELKVIKVTKDNETHSFICRYSSIKGTYIEIFTGEQIDVTDKNSVVSLSEYYPPLARQKYKTGEPLMVGKKELLRKYIDINSENYMHQNELLNDDEESIELTRRLLEKATKAFFPEIGSWKSSCFSRPNSLSMRNLPCHLRDDEWLARMLKENQNLYFMSHNKILNFIKTSPLFQERRHKYELEIVRWQIEWIMSGGENWICDDEYGGDFVFLTPVCDLGVRKGVVDTLTKIGIAEEVIEEGLEKYASMWRDSIMERAFNNEYSFSFILVNSYGESNNELPPIDPEHKEKWLRMRKHEYYERHKDSIVKYGVIEPEMIMTEAEAEELRKYLEEKHRERKRILEEYSKRRNSSTDKNKIYEMINI